jgi:hypothetical protein
MMSPSPLQTEISMDANMRFSYELRLAELESQIQSLLSWKKQVLATLSTVIQPTTPTRTSTRARRHTADVVPFQRQSAIIRPRVTNNGEWPKREKVAAISTLGKPCSINNFRLPDTNS